MSIQASIESKLSQQFSPLLMAVENESHGHNVAANSETHFKVVMVSDDFVDKRKVARHQAVYACLADELQQGVHALALHLYSPDEWRERETAPESPKCMGGSKK